MPAALFCPETYKKALRCASNAHCQQKTPNGEPYMVHVNSVAMEIIQSLHIETISFDEGTLAVCCALLHDTIEDTSITTYDLEVFGHEVVEGVAALTKDKDMSKAAAMQESVARLLLQPKAVQRVKLADRICNLDRPPKHWDAHKCRSYQKEALFILQELREASAYLSERLEKKIEAYDRYISELEDM